MALIPEQPWPGERLSLWEIDEISSTGKNFSPLFIDGPTGTVTLEPGDEFWAISYRSDLLRAEDPIGVCSWILSATSGSITIETSQAIGSWDDYPAQPAWGPPTTVTVSATARGIVPLIEAARTFELISQMDGASSMWPAVKIRVISGSAACDDLTLQVEPPGGMLEVVSTTYSSTLTPDPRTSGTPVSLGTAVRAYGLTTFTGDFDAGVNDALQDAAAVARVGGNTDVATGVASPAYGPYEGFSRAEVGVIDGIHHADVRLAVEYSQAGPVDVTVFRQTPQQLEGDRKAGRDWVFDDTDPLGVGVRWASGDTEFTGWTEQSWMWHQIDGYNISYLAVLDGTVADAVGSGPWAGHYGGSFPPVLGSAIDSASPGDLDPTIAIAEGVLPDAPGFTLVKYSASLTGAAVPVAGGGPLAPGASWAVQIKNGDGGGTVFAIYRYQEPDFQYLIPTWGPSPLAVGAEPRFFVKDTEGVMRAVGPGKPDDEFVFLVPTPVGFYRDMTAAEYAMHPVPPSG